MMVLREDFQKRFPEPGGFDQILGLQGDVFRELGGRRTLRFEQNGQGFFLKAHFGVGWKEIFKNLFAFRLPVLGAKNEYLAIKRCEQLGVETMAIAAYGCRGWNPARLESFLITEELSNTVSLEDYCRNWPTEPPPVALKRALVSKVAQMSRLLHENGVNHRDYYICHFLLDLATAKPFVTADELKLHLIDLHRVQIRQTTPQRWVVKDVSGLFFSSADIGLTSRDIYRFLKLYRGKPLRRILSEDTSFLQRVYSRADKLYKKTFHRAPSFAVLPLRHLGK